MSRWIMSMKREVSPIRYRFFIGRIPIAEISFDRGAAVLTTFGTADDPTTVLVETRHESMSAAMTEMHRLLQAPSPDGSKVGGMKQ